MALSFLAWFVFAPQCMSTIAVARLMLDNLPHVKAYWIMLGLKIAQIALHYGADDIDARRRYEAERARRKVRVAAPVGEQDLGALAE